MSDSIKYSKTIAEKICERIATGETLNAICLEPEMPSHTVIFKWFERYPDFKQSYENARILQADYFADEMVELKNLARENPANASAYRVAADILRWQASVRQPRKYGDKLEVDVNKKIDPDKIRDEIERLSVELGVKRIIEVKPETGE